MTCPVNRILKYFLLLILLPVILIPGGLILNLQVKTDIETVDLISLTFSFSITSLIVLIIFFKGQTKEKSGQPLYTLAAVTVKFLIEMVIALILFISAKKTSLSYILLFFVLYLTFSLFSIWVILNTLKNKSL